MKVWQKKKNVKKKKVDSQSRMSDRVIAGVARFIAFVRLGTQAEEALGSIHIVIRFCTEIQDSIGERGAFIADLDRAVRVLGKATEGDKLA